MNSWSLFLKCACCLLVGYLMGAINPAYLIARLKGFDIRKRGSGNAGASNALILFGKTRGALCAAVDISKGYLSVFVMTRLMSDLPLAFPITATACILGHIFPFYMNFRGGKGLACLCGIVLCYDWRYFLVALTIALMIALTTRYICFIPITAAIAFPISYGLMRHDLWGALILTVASLVVLMKHMENLARIRRGTEMRLSYLWNKEKEIKRLEENTGWDSKDYL